MKTSFSALALLFVFALFAAASPSFAASACGASATLPALSQPARTPASFGDLDICSGTCTVTCESGATDVRYDVSPETCCGQINFRPCSDGTYPTSTEFWPTFSNGPGGCFAQIC